MAFQIVAAAVPEVTGDLPVTAASSVKQLPHLRGLQLADPQFYNPGKVDLLLGENILAKLVPSSTDKVGPEGTPTAVKTVFGWAIRGLYSADKNQSTGQAAVHTTVTTVADRSDEMLTRFWEAEEPSKPSTAMTPEESRVKQHYDDTTVYISSTGKYMVSRPKKPQAPELGDQALQRYGSNERSILNRGTWVRFQAVIQEYLDLGHARPVTKQEMESPTQDCYYLPMHGVCKESSSTTKLRVVFDASAKAANHISLNNTLSVGPTLHATLDQILIRFRTYRIALSGDISKMYREVLLSPKDRQLHRFLWCPQTDQPVKDYCMQRVTFGVASSPYLAVQTLQQAAADFGSDFPEASWHISGPYTGF